MSQPLAGMRLWIARPEDELAPSLARFHKEGAEVEGMPLVERVDIPVGPDVLEGLPAGSTVVLASGHAARRWLECVQRCPPLAAWPVAVVGQRAGRELGELEPGVCWRAPTAAALLAELEGDGPFVLAGSSARRPELPEGLAARGATTVELDLYAPRRRDELDEAVRQRWSRRRPGALAFYSPSGVDAFAGLDLPGARDVAALALGPTTASRLREHGIEPVVVGDPPGESSLLAATIRWWAARR